MKAMKAENSSETDNPLVDLARRGDDAAWQQLVQKYQEPVFRLAYLITGSVHDAQDTAQETFIRAFLHLDRYDDGRPLRPWLLGIAANLARNKRRGIGRYWNAVQRFFQANRQEAATHPQVNRADAQLLWQAVQKLPDASRAVIYLRYFLDLSEAETAEALDIPRGTVKSRSYRALHKLREIIEKDYPELADERTRS
jgi:RNA polymerase sigma-70 factor (ECF subfamily)